MNVNLTPSRRHALAPADGWEPFSRSILARLRLARAAALQEAALKAAATQGAPGGAPTGRPTLDDLKAQNAAMAAGFDLDIASEFGLEMDALLAPPPDPVSKEPVLERHEVLLALRLAATLGGPDRIGAVCQPTAVTVLEGIPPDDFDTVVTLLRHAVLPAALRVSQSAKAFAAQDEGLLIVLPAEATRAGSASAARDLRQAFADALSAPVGVLLLLPSSTSLEAEVVESGAARMTFAPVGRAVIVEFLRINAPRGAAFDATTVAAALPPEATLAGLSDVALRTALRRRTPIEVAQALSEPPKQSPGPKLGEMTGGGEALVLARAMVADLHLWAEGKVEWSDLTQSLLLHGQPGTGKTWLARAMGNCPGLGFVAASFPQWQADGHLGQMLAAMRASFAAAVAMRRRFCSSTKSTPSARALTATATAPTIGHM